MQILVISDTHGSTNKIVDVIEKHNDIDEILFLGDGLRDIESVMLDYPQKNFTLVAGNCDHACGIIKKENYKCYNKKVIYMTHGHELGVKSGLYGLIEKTQSVLGNIALYGHTHKPHNERDISSGIYLVNPGSLANSCYAVLDISLSGKVEVKLMNL